MATESLSRAVTSTLELLAGYAYTTPADPVRTDPAYKQLQPLGVAADALIKERNDLRDHLQAALDELEKERQSSRTNSSFLKELIRRVQTLPEDTASELLDGIEMPAEGAFGLVLPLLLEEAALRRVPLTSHRVGMETLAELPTINAYLDRALEKAQQSRDLYAVLELAPAPCILKTWEDLAAGLNASLSPDQPLIQTVTVKAQALSVLKSMETVSLEAAVRGFQRMRNKLEDVVAESESWVVEELYHKRLPEDCDLKANIQARIQLAQAVFTVENMEKLMTIFYDYEDLRKIAVLKPWEERVQPESEWWRLVTAGQQLFAASEAVLRRVNGDREAAQLKEEMKRLHQETTVSSEGVFSFLSGLLDVLMQTERIKDDYLRRKIDDQIFNVLHDLCRDVLNLSMVFAAFANEPLTDLLRLNSVLNRSDSDPELLARELHPALQRLLQAITPRLTEKVSFKWLKPVLEECSLRGSEDVQRRISATLSWLVEEDAQSFKAYQAKRGEIESCLIQTLSHMQTQYEALQEQSQATIDRLERELGEMREAVGDACYTANSAASDLAEVADSRLKEAGSALLSSIPASASAGDKIQALGTALQTLTTSYVDYHSAATEEKTEILTHLLSDLQRQMDSVFPGAVSLAENADKEDLVVKCRSTLHSDMPPQTLFSTQLALISTVLLEAKTVLRSRTASLDTVTLVRKGKHILDSVARNAEDLAKSTVDPENEQRTREVLQKATKSVGNMGLADLLNAVIEVLDVERQQVDIKLHEGFSVADVCESSLAPVSPVKRLSSVPTADQKLSTGFTHLRQRTKRLIEILEIVIDEEEYKRKGAALEHFSGLDRLMQEQGIILWLLQQATQSCRQPLEPLLAASLTTLEAVAAQVADPGDRQDVQAAIHSTREEGKQTTRSLRELILGVEELSQARLHLLSRETEQPGAPTVLKGIERLMSVYEAELLTHGIKITVTQDDVSILQGSDEQQIALSRLTIMERALRALAEKAAAQKQEAKENKDYITRSSRTIYATVLEVLEIVSLEETEEVRKGESQLDDQLKKIESATVRLRNLIHTAYVELETTNGPSTPRDLRTLLAELSPASAASEASVPPEAPQRTKLLGFPPKASPYSQLDKVVIEAGTSLIRLLNLQGIKDLAASGSSRMSVAAGSGDAMAIIGDKLAFIKEAGDFMGGNYEKNIGLSLFPVFESAKRNLNTARGLLKNSQKKEEIWTVVSQLGSRVSANKQEVRVCLETAETTMQQVLAELSMDLGAEFDTAEGEESVEPVEARKKLSALPNSSDKVSTGMEFLMRQTGHILSSLSISLAPETMAQLQQISTQSGQEKLLLQQAVLHLELKEIQTSLTAAFTPLTNQVLQHVRIVANFQGNSADIEPALQDIEASISQNGVSLSLLSNSVEILDAQLQDLIIENADYEEFTATSAEVRSQSGPPLLRSRLMALPTAAERLSKGMDFLLRETDTLYSALSLPADRDRPAQAQKIREATGQDQLLLQQTLIHSLLKRVSGQLTSYMRESARQLKVLIRTTANSKGCGSKINPEIVKIEQEVEAEGLRSEQVLKLLGLMDKTVAASSVALEYEETEAEVQSSPAEELRSRLSAGNTSGDRLGKGLDFVIKQEMDLMELLGLLRDGEYSDLLTTCNEATGQDRLIQQQNLLYKGLKAACVELRSSLVAGLEQGWAISQHLLGLLSPGSPKTSFTEAIESISKENKAYGPRMSQLTAVLEQLVQLKSHLSPLVSGVRPPKSGSSPWETMSQLLSQLGSYIGRPPMTTAVSDSKELPNTCQAELSGCLMDLKAVVGKTLSGFISHSRYLDSFIPAGEAKQRSVAAFNELEMALNSPTAPRLPLLPVGLERLSSQQALIRPFAEEYSETTAASNDYEAEEIEGPGTKLACRPMHHRPRRNKLSSVPTSGDRLDKGIVYVLKELGSFVDILDAPPGQAASEIASQVETAEGQDKVLLRQSLLHSEVKRLAVLLQERISALHSRLLTFLSNFQFSPEQASVYSRLQSLELAHFSDLVEEEALLETALTQMDVYSEADVQEDVVMGEVRTRLSAVPNSGDKVGKGMDLLLKLTGQIYHVLIGHPADYMETELQRIHGSTGQDKVLLQQALLHRELKDVLQTAETHKKVVEEEAYEEVEEVKVETAPGERTKLQSANVPGKVEENSLFEEVFTVSLETLAAFKVFVSAETQAEIEKLRSTAPSSKAAIQQKVVLLSLASLRAQAESLKTEEQDRAAVSGLLTRLKLALESFLGAEFTTEWRTVASAALGEKLKVIANHVDKFETRLKHKQAESPAAASPDPASALIPLLQQSTSSEVSSLLNSGDVLGAAESCLRLWLTDSQETVQRLSAYIQISAEMPFSLVIQTLDTELQSLCEVAEVRESTLRLAAVRSFMQAQQSKVRGVTDIMGDIEHKETMISKKTSRKPKAGTDQK